ncbi:MAG: hypothetical protein RR292_02525 [Christensenellaceae bacterium]
MLPSKSLCDGIDISLVEFFLKHRGLCRARAGNQVKEETTIGI